MGLGMLAAGSDGQLTVGLLQATNEVACPGRSFRNLSPRSEFATVVGQLMLMNDH
jgi:hypothetical protein